MKTHVKNLTSLLFLSILATITFTVFSCSNDDDADPTERAHDWEELSLEKMQNNGGEYQSSLNERTILESAVSTDTYNMFDPENGKQTTDFAEQIMEHYKISKSQIKVGCQHEGDNPLTLRYALNFGDTNVISQSPSLKPNEITIVNAKEKSMRIGFTNKITKMDDYVFLSNYKIIKQVEYVDGSKKVRYRTTFTSTYDLGQGKTKVVNWSFYTPSY